MIRLRVVSWIRRRAVTAHLKVYEEKNKTRKKREFPMPNIRLQDLTATINGTSRFNGGKWDTVHVETLLVTDEPLRTDMNWFVPAGVSEPHEVLAIFNAAGISMFPTLEANLLTGTEDIRDQAQQNNLPEVEKETLLNL